MCNTRTLWLKRKVPRAPFRLIFNEACLHCTLAWTNPNTQRRSLLYRYCPRYLTLANSKNA